MGKEPMKLLICLFCLLTACAFSVDLAGVYDLVGSNNPLGEKHYIGRVTITPQGTNYRVQWKVGKQTQKGIGIVHDDIFSVAYHNPKDEEMGVASYYITPTGNLEGKWAELDDDMHGRELLLFKSALDK